MLVLYTHLNLSASDVKLHIYKYIYNYKEEQKKQVFGVFLATIYDIFSQMTRRKISYNLKF